MSLTIDEIKNKIRTLEDINLKIITDLVAYQIHKGPYGKTPGENFISAENAVSQYISTGFGDIDEVNECIKKLGDGMVGIEEFARNIYSCYHKQQLDFTTVKDEISAKKNISLKTITDMVAYKLSQSPNDQGPEINYITAETFVAQYISKHFHDIDTFKSTLKKFGDGMQAIETFSALVYNKFRT